MFYSMAKVFSLQDEIHESPNRNNHDLSHRRHMTGKFGVITPFLCERVVPTDAWEIDTAVGLNLMPMWYPTQTPMRVIVHYFYVPYRIMWKSWKNFLEGLSDDEVPYLDHPASFYRTGTLADFLGIPTTYVLPEDTMLAYQVYDVDERSHGKSFFMKNGYSYSGPGSLFTQVFDTLNPQDGLTSMPEGKKSIGFFSSSALAPVSPIVHNTRYFDAHFDLPVSVQGPINVQLCFFGSDEPFDGSTFGNLRLLGQFLTVQNVTGTSQISMFGLSQNSVNTINGYIGQANYVYPCLFLTVPESPGSSGTTILSGYLTAMMFSTAAGETLEIADHPEYCPYFSTGHTTNTEKVRSLAFRGYEMIYNSFYRDSHGSQPFVVDGVTQYNNYITTDEGGSDTTDYELKTKNWELDAYTSCLPSPQQGDAPLIGVSIDGTMRISHDDGTTSTVQLRDVDGSAGLEYTNSRIDPEHPEDARTILSLSSSGMTIADFRAGNALTRFLETSMRTGFRYADFIFGHFGKSPSHQELDMPVFLGGYTQVVDTSKVTNVTAPTPGTDMPELGQFAGTGASFGSSKHAVKHYFDDFGLVYGLMMVVPEPAYSQVMPKHFLSDNRLDFYFPEFSQLGLQPITYEELCPIQSYAEYVNGQSSKLLTDTFGYQRPNHDLVWLPDTTHGLFRTSLRGSVIQRRFGVRPELSDAFLRIKPEECNDIFSVVEAKDDVWVGQVVVNIKAQRPVPRIVIPSLGR